MVCFKLVICALDDIELESSSEKTPHLIVYNVTWFRATRSFQFSKMQIPEIFAWRLGLVLQICMEQSWKSLCCLHLKYPSSLLPSFFFLLVGLFWLLCSLHRWRCKKKEPNGYSPRFYQQSTGFCCCYGRSQFCLKMLVFICYSGHFPTSTPPVLYFDF